MGSTYTRWNMNNRSVSIFIYLARYSSQGVRIVRFKYVSKRKQIAIKFNLGKNVILFTYVILIFSLMKSSGALPKFVYKNRSHIADNVIMQTNHLFPKSITKLLLPSRETMKT